MALNVRLQQSYQQLTYTSNICIGHTALTILHEVLDIG